MNHQIPESHMDDFDEAVLICREESPLIPERRHLVALYTAFIQNLKQCEALVVKLDTAMRGMSQDLDINLLRQRHKEAGLN